MYSDTLRSEYICSANSIPIQEIFQTRIELSQFTGHAETTALSIGNCALLGLYLFFLKSPRQREVLPILGCPI